MKTQKPKKKPIASKPAAKNSMDRITRIEREILLLKRKCKELSNGRVFTVPIETLAPEPFALKRIFHVVIEPSDGEFIASFLDANISMSGDTAEEALRGLKASIVDTFDDYEEMESILGPGPKRQLAVLREFIRRQP